MGRVVIIEADDEAIAAIAREVLGMKPPPSGVLTTGRASVVLAPVTTSAGAPAVLEAGQEVRDRAAASEGGRAGKSDKPTRSKPAESERQPKRTGRGFTEADREERMATVTAAYLKAQADGKPHGPAMAKALGTSETQAYKWLKKAREAGVAPPSPLDQPVGPMRRDPFDPEAVRAAGAEEATR